MVSIEPIKNKSEITEFLNVFFIGILDELVQGFLTGDLELFMKRFKLDIVSDYYLRRWFSGYAIKVASPISCKYNIESIQDLKENYVSITKFQLDYEDNDSETVYLKMIAQRDSNQNLVVTDVQVNLVHPQWPDKTDNNYPVDVDTVKNEIYKIESSKYKTKNWWEDKELIDIYSKSEDLLKPSIYARAIPKSVRFRNTHPEIDCAAVLSDMMSYKSARLVYILKEGSIGDRIKKINSFYERTLKAKTYSEVKKEDPSYFPARELSLVSLYNIDETYYLLKTVENPEISCVDLASLYTSLFRLSGMTETDVYVVIQPFHYLTVFKLPKSYYIISLNEIMPMGKKRLYGDTEVTRILTPTRFIDSEGQTNMSDDFYGILQEFFKNGIPIFSIPKAKEFINVLPSDICKCPTVDEYDSPEELNRAMVKYVFEMSKKYPASPFTWAKYSYQTLLVNQPQAYALWSIKSNEIVNFATNFTSVEQLLKWTSDNIKCESIFQEDHRIMTADQVLRNSMGGFKDKALFIYSVLKNVNLLKTGGVVITGENSYVILKGAELSIIDCKNLILVSEIEEEIILAFDYEICYTNLTKSESKKPEWL